MLTALVVLGFGNPDDAWRWALTAYITYAVEVIGVQTGFPFGDYQYGTRLGTTLYDTPPMIGVLWLLTLMGTLYWADNGPLTAKGVTEACCAQASPPP